MSRKHNLIVAILILLVVAEGTVIVNSSRNRKQAIPRASDSQIQPNVSNQLDKISPFPALNIPREYFPKGQLEQKAVYQSYPSTTTTIAHYSSETIPVKSKSMDEVKKGIIEVYDDFSETWLNAAEKNYKLYGDLATNYLPLSYIHKIDKFDIDNDGVLEKIVAHMYLGSADGGGYMTDIIRDNKIIFQAKEITSRIEKADTNNGFFVEWQNESLNWYDGFMRTRFVWKDNQFVPVYEQEVRFVKL